MTADQLAFLLELLNTPGLRVPIDQCKVAHETQEALKAEWQKAVEAEKPK